MKKLVKKINTGLDSIEAYGCGCTCSCSCSCTCDSSTQQASTNYGSTYSNNGNYTGKGNDYNRYI